MKVSNYNFFFPYDYEEGKYVAYNALSNSMALIDKNNYNKYLNFENYNIQIDDDKLVEDLKIGSFILEDDLDELLIIRHNMYAERFNTGIFALTIAPTSDCNFRCVYCYEKNAISSTYMTEETENNIVKMLERRIKQISNFNVTWYGGEPLLAMDTIQRLSEKFIEICDTNKIDYSSGIVTNGYNLTKKNWEKLKNYKVNSIQITIDGDEITHNQRRPLKNGGATFGKIISNLVELKEDIIPINLRINTDRTNSLNIEEILKILQKNELTNVIYPYIARVDNSNDCYNDSTCLGIDECLDIGYEFADLMIEHGYESSKIKKYHYPTRKNINCGCDRFESYIVNADGELYKCWDDIGKQNMSIGNINTESAINLNKSYFDYMMFDPTIDNKCSSCKFVPICMGGCPYRRINNPKIMCDDIKYKIDVRLKNIALHLKEQNENKQKCSECIS